RTFTERSAGIVLVLTPVHRVLFADVDGDGHVDLVTSEARIYLGDGTGNWTPTFGPAGSFLDVAVGDVNGDGQAELVCVSQNAVAASIFTHTAAGWVPL